MKYNEQIEKQYQVVKLNRELKKKEKEILFLSELLEKLELKKLAIKLKLLGLGARDFRTKKNRDEK